MNILVLNISYFPLLCWVLVRGDVGWGRVSTSSQSRQAVAETQPLSEDNPVNLLKPVLNKLVRLSYYR